MRAEPLLTRELNLSMNNIEELGNLLDFIDNHPLKMPPVTSELCTQEIRPLQISFLLCAAQKINPQHPLSPQLTSEKRTLPRPSGTKEKKLAESVRWIWRSSMAECAPDCGRKSGGYTERAIVKRKRSRGATELFANALLKNQFKRFVGIESAIFV
jgi:hypothetical protein